MGGALGGALGGVSQGGCFSCLGGDGGASLGGVSQGGDTLSFVVGGCGILCGLL